MEQPQRSATGKLRAVQRRYKIAGAYAEMCDAALGALLRSKYQNILAQIGRRCPTMPAPAGRCCLLSGLRGSDVLLF